MKRTRRGQEKIPNYCLVQYYIDNKTDIYATNVVNCERFLIGEECKVVFNKEELLGKILAMNGKLQVYTL